MPLAFRGSKRERDLGKAKSVRPTTTTTTAEKYVSIRTRFIVSRAFLWLFHGSDGQTDYVAPHTKNIPSCLAWPLVKYKF